MAGDPRVLHHTLNFLIPPGADPRNGFTATPDPGAAYIQAYVPGASPHVEPENTGGLLRKGSMLALQWHYTTFRQEAVADYNYNWQITYEPVDLIFVPGGTKIHVIGAFDNSSQNPANPDPDRLVP